MTASFETSDEHAQFHLKPLRVPMRADQVFDEAKDLVVDLSGWSIVRADAEQRVLVCRRSKSVLSSESTITITCQGPEGLPSTVVHVRSESSGGLLSRDRANVLAFMVPFHRRVC